MKIILILITTILCTLSIPNSFAAPIKVFYGNPAKPEYNLKSKSFFRDLPTRVQAQLTEKSFNFVDHIEQAEYELRLVCGSGWSFERWKCSATLWSFKAGLHFSTSNPRPMNHENALAYAIDLLPKGESLDQDHAPSSLPSLVKDQETTVSKTTYYNNPTNSGSAYDEAEVEADANMKMNCGSRGYTLIAQKTLLDKTTTYGSTFEEVYEGVWHYKCNP